MPAGYRSRSQYLSLAHFSHELVASLFDYIDSKQPSASFSQQLADALQSLEDVKNGDLYKFGQKRSAALSTSEQVRTLNEIWSEPDIDQAIALIGRLRDQPQQHRKADAKKLIKLFSRLRAKALWNFEQSVPRPPAEVREPAPAR
jgi:hypothetical protein